MRLISNLVMLGFLPACSIVFLWWAFDAVVDGRALSALIAVLFALAFAGFASQWAVLRWSARPRIESGPTGTTIRPRRLYDSLSMIWIGAAVCGSLLYTALVPSGLVEIPTFRNALPWMMIFIIVFGVPTLWRMIVHGGDCYLRLTPTTCEIWNGQWLSMRRARWNDIVEVRDQPLRRQLRGREVIALALPEGRSGTLLSDAITDDSDALRKWVRFYWQRPEHRAELTDGRATRRLAEMSRTGD
ncbi:hypothetical protein [Mycolicibacterium sp. A43C]